MAKTFLIIQLRPEDETADNELHAMQNYAGLKDYEISRHRIEQTQLTEIDLEKYAAIIVGGSPFDVSTPKDEKSDVQNRIEADFTQLFDQIVKRDFPFLGCCSGNGLLGFYCGAEISSRYAEPVGGVDVTLTEAGVDDPLLIGFPRTIRVLTGHKEACEATPPGCTLLMTNSSCPVQMFKLNNNVYATQFHPEGDADGFTTRINVYRNHGYFPPESARMLIDKIASEDTPHARAILKRFVERFRA